MRLKMSATERMLNAPSGGGLGSQCKSNLQISLLYGCWSELTRVLAAFSVEFFRYPAKELSKIFYVALLLHNITEA